MATDEQELVEELKEKGVLKSPLLYRALTEIDRADFVPEDLSYLAYKDTSLPIDYGQTISQPYTVVFMLEQLEVQLGQKILEIGYGSGWQTALLAHMVGESGSVYAMELVPELCQQGKNNLQKYPHLLLQVHFICKSAKKGFEEGAPYDRIIAAAEVQDVSQAWKEQLSVGGRMIYPQDGGLTLEWKSERGFESKRIPGFVFVPFI